MKARDRVRANELDAVLVAHSRDRRPLPGIDDLGVRGVFVSQMIDSLHRVRYPVVMAARTVSPRRADPGDPEYFDPVRAAALYLQRGDIDEASWLVFLFVHFGKHARGGYRYLRDVYGRLGEGGRWDWATLSGDVPGFLTWLDERHEMIRHRGGPGGFGNHRKYESLKPENTGRAIASYVEWIDPARGHRRFFDETLEVAAGNPGAAFDSLYDSMSRVTRFGRTARFDYLTMVGKLGIAPIAPTSVRLSGATGPRSGTRLLYEVDEDVRDATLEAWLRELDADLNVGPQVLEDAICNWQKSPDRYRAFRG